MGSSPEPNSGPEWDPDWIPFGSQVGSPLESSPVQPRRIVHGAANARRTGSHHFGHSQTPLTQTCESGFAYIRVHPRTSAYVAGSLRMHSSCGFRRSPGVPGPGRGPPGIVLQGPSGNDEMMESCPPCVRATCWLATREAGPVLCPSVRTQLARLGPLQNTGILRFPGTRVPADGRDPCPWETNNSRVRQRTDPLPGRGGLRQMLGPG